MLWCFVRPASLTETRTRGRSSQCLLSKDHSTSCSGGARLKPSTRPQSLACGEVFRMQSLEEFMREFLRDRVEEEKREQAQHALFRKKYYSEDCHWGNRAGVLEKYQSESLITASTSETTGEAITIFTNPYHTEASRVYRCRLRYHLKLVAGRWLIHSLDFECRYCKGEKGSRVCHFCGGEGWIPSIRARRPPTTRGEPPPPDPFAE